MENGKQLDDTGEGPDTGSDCDVLEENFPCVEKCYSKCSSIEGTSYKNTCPYFSTWTSLPDGVSLEITYIFDCSLYGYGKRTKK